MLSFRIILINGNIEIYGFILRLQTLSLSIDRWLSATKLIQSCRFPPDSPLPRLPAAARCESALLWRPACFEVATAALDRWPWVHLSCLCCFCLFGRLPLQGACFTPSLSWILQRCLVELNSQKMAHTLENSTVSWNWLPPMNAQTWL